MRKSKSQAKMNWFQRFWMLATGHAGGNKRRLSRNRMQTEQLEPRIVLSAILLDIPGVNGDAVVLGATATDIELTSFEWGFSRDGGAATSPTAPIEFTDLKFEKKLDSGTNDLYAQSNFSPVNGKVARLRLVDDVVTPGKTLLSFDLTSSRVTSFSTKDGGTETGSLSFGKIDFTESQATVNSVTNRTASWNLLTGGVTKSAIVGPGNIDNSKNGQPTENPLNIETVLEIGGQKLLIDDFSWGAGTAGDVLALPGSLTKARGNEFKITRDVDSGTAGLLGSAAAGTNLGKVTITDRTAILGVNKVTLQWNLYDTSISDFGLSAKNDGVLTNSLGLSYSKIELTAIEFNGETGKQGKTLTTIWDEANNLVTPAVDFGTADPLLADAAPVASYLDFGALGRVRYNEIDWSVSKPTTIDGKNITQGKTAMGPASVTLAAGPSTPALLGSLAKLSVLPTVAAKEQNKSDVTSVLDTWTLTNAAVTNFAISSEGLDAPVVEFDLDFQSSVEAYNDRNIPLITRGNFNEVTQTSTGALIFGVEVPIANPNFDFEFELEITQTVNGKSVKTEIPVTIAEWAANRDIFRNPANGNVSGGTLAAGTFDLSIPRGIHSPGLFAAAARGTKIESAVVRRYDTVGKGQIELYHWELTNAFLTSYASHRLPGNSAEEVDRISFNPSKIALVNANNKGGTSYDFITAKPGGGGSIENPLEGSSTVLQTQIDGLGTKFFAIDSFSWGAKLPVDATTTSGERPLGNPDASDLTLNVTGLPSPALLNKLFVGTAIAKTTLKLPANKNSPGTDYIATLTEGIFATGYSYKDELTPNAATNSLSLFPGNKAELGVRPVNAQGQPGTPRVATWDLKTDSIAAKPSFGGFQFAPNESPDTVLEFFDGTSGGQVAASGFTFGTRNPVVQLVGKTGAPVTLAPRGIASPSEFNVVTRLDQTSPAIFSAIAQKTALPEIKITEHRTMTVAGSQQFLPYREWVLTNVFIENMADSATAFSPLGTVGLTLNPGSATSTLINYDAAGKAVPASRQISFVAPPTSTPLGLITGISTDAPRVVDTPSRFVDEQEASSTLRYSVAVVSGANLFDSVSLNAINRLVLDYKAGQGGLAQLRVDATDSFGLVNSLLVNVALDADGIGAAPAGTNLTVTTNEDTPYTITAADFGFTDPNDFPANTFTSVTVFSLPVKGSLTLNNVAVTVNQLISVANINSELLKYTPLPNENGNTYASFQFQVRDNGSVNNVDLSPNTLTFNVTPVNDAPVMAAGSAFITMPAIAEDTTSPAGVLLSALAPLITDADAGDSKGIAVIFANNANGNWQYALDGTTFQNFGLVSNSSARLLALETTRIRFVPNLNFNTPVGFAGVELHFVAWDRTVGSIGGTIDVPTLGGRGGVTAFSESPGVYFQKVTPVNDAPTLNAPSVFLPQINEDTTNPAGALVSSLLTGMSDVDAGAVKGLAVRSLSSSGGAWQYSLNGGTTWIAFGSVSTATARLLPADASTKVRFVPNANFAGNRGFSFYAWDQTSGTAGGTADLSLATAKGGTTAFSTDIELGIATQVTAAVNDLPNVTSPSVASLVVNTPLVFSTANANAITVTDVDAASGEMQVAITVLNGRFNLSTLTGITVTAGSNGTGAFTIRGTLAAINAALAGSSLTGNLNYFGSGILQLVVNDLGNTGSGGAKTRTKNVEFVVQALPIAINLGALDGVSATGFENGAFTTGQTASRFYSFTLPGVSDVRLLLSGLTANADLQVFRTNGQLLSEGINTGVAFENVLESALAAGTYIVAVRPTGVATSFNLSVSTATASDDLIVNANDLGTLNATTRPTVFVPNSVSGLDDRQDYFKFTTTVASPLRVSFSGLSDNYDIHLLNANGAVVGSNVLPGTNIKTISRSNLPAGDYFIRVSGFANRNLSSYALGVTVVSTNDDLISQAVALGTPNASTLPVLRRRGGTVNGTTDIQDYVSFIVADPTDVRINLSGLSADVDFSLLDSGGRVIPISGGGNGGNANENALAPGLAAGTYFVRVFSFDGAPTTYELAIAIDPLSDDLLSNAVSLGEISPSVPTVQQSGNVSLTSDETDYYQFTLVETTSDVRVNLSGLSADADVTLEDSFGRFIADSTAGSNGLENLIATGLVAGSYRIRVQGAAAATNYLLTVSQTPTSDDLISNATVLATLTSGTLPSVRTSSAAGGSDIQDYYRFQLNSISNLRVGLSNMTTDLDVQVLDQFGQVVASGTQSGNTNERVLTPELAVGTYYIRVFQQIGGGPVSNYNLEFSTDFNGDDVIGPRTQLGILAAAPLSTLTGSGTVGGVADIQDYFSFTLSSTRNVRFQLTNLTQDIDIQVLNSFGQVVGSGTNGLSNPEDITLNNLLAGVYYIRIFPFETAVSNYSLSVTGV